MRPETVGNQQALLSHPETVANQQDEYRENDHELAILPQPLHSQPDQYPKFAHLN
jgi:hypothetical protein